MTDKPKVQGIADVKIISDRAEVAKVDSAMGKNFLRVIFENGTQVDMSFNLAEMIGGVAKGANLRFGYTTEESYKQRKH